MILHGNPDDLCIQNILFDFDGTLADTESVFAVFDCRLLNEVLEQVGLPPALQPTYIRTLAGKNGEEKLATISEQYNFGPAPYLKAFTDRRTALRKTLFRDETAPYAEGLLEFLDAQKGRFAMATNKTPEKIHMDLDHMTELATRFENKVFCLQHDMNKKPAPDILLYAAREMGFDPARTAYVGDNAMDMQAAVQAGMIPIGIIIEKEGDHTQRQKDLIKAGAALIISDMDDLT